MNEPSSKERDMLTELIQTLVSVIEEKNIHMRGHSRKVAVECVMFAQQVDLSVKEIEAISFAALLCDIGMVYIPIEIIQKPDKLTSEEMGMVKQHPVVSEKIFRRLSFLENTLPIIRHHHEAFDGNGYPDGLTAEKIPIGARILTLVDNYIALTSVRPHRPAMDGVTALREIIKRKGQNFDPDLTETFVKHMASKIKIKDYEKKKTDEPASVKKTANDTHETLQPLSAKNLVSEIINKFKKEEISLPVLPKIIQDIQEVISDSDATVGALAKVIQKDAIISVRLVSTANSPLFAGHQKILTVSDAITRMGLKETQSIVSATITKNIFQSGNNQLIALMEKLWLHSLSCGYAAKCIALRLGFEDPERFFLIGLSHDIGKVVLLKAVSEMSERDFTMNENEIVKNIQAVHTSIGGVTMRHWKFSRAFIESATSHNNSKFDSTTMKSTLVVHLANMLTRKIGYSFFENDTDLAELDSAKRLNLDLENLNAIGEDVVHMMQNSANTF